MKTIKQNHLQFNLFPSFEDYNQAIADREAEVYPNSPGYQNQDTSKQAAEDVKLTYEHYRYLIVEKLTDNPMTADECAKLLGREKLYIRPRFTELNKSGYIRDTGQRRKNDSGKMAIVWEVVS